MTKSEGVALGRRLTVAVAEADPPVSTAALARALGVTRYELSKYLSGTVTCPKTLVGRIASMTGADKKYLLTGKRSRATAARRSSSDSALGWAFRPAPSDGGKDFGNAGVYATPPAVKTIVREDGQNSLDASEGRVVTLRFRVVELHSGTTRYTAFCRAIGLNKLRAHLQAVADGPFSSKLGNKLEAGLEYVTDEKLILLIVDDYGTHGLRGGEFDSSKSFSALVRDNLNSRKDASTAGGVYGVGAKVNLACSRLSTVLFASKVHGEEELGTRLIGRSELTYHELDGSCYAGPGWFGKRTKNGTVESAWLADSSSVLDALLLRRDRLPPQVRARDASGTSIAIVGFGDPDTEATGATDVLVDQLIEAAAVNFWPAIEANKLAVWVERYVDDDAIPVRSEKVEPRTIAGVAPFCEAWERYASGALDSALTKPGDVVATVVSFTVPGMRRKVKGLKHHEEQEAECRLVVRLADPDSEDRDPRVNQLAYMRGNAMVTRYQSRVGATAAGRPFHAFLVAGKLVAGSLPHLAADQFLRLAEPPAHDKWKFTEEVAEHYERGAKTKLDTFLAQVIEALQRTLRPNARSTREGPELLRRLMTLPLVGGGSGGGKAQRPKARVLQVTARVLDGAWHVEAEVSVTPSNRQMLLTPRLSFSAEGGSPVRVRWATLNGADPKVDMDEHAFVLPPHTTRLTFTGVSDPASHPIDAGSASAVLDVSVAPARAS